MCSSSIERLIILCKRRTFLDFSICGGPGNTKYIICMYVCMCVVNFNTKTPIQINLIKYTSELFSMHTGRD